MKYLNNQRFMSYAFVAVLVALVILEPAHAQEWAKKVDGMGQQIITGLKLIGRTVATITLMWFGVQLFMGTKRFADVQGWFIGAAFFLAVTEIISLVFGQ